MPEQSVFEVEMAVEKLKSHKSPSIFQIPAELINAECKTFRSEINKLEILNHQQMHLFITRIKC